jgi:uncharacterized protein YyaL (SSP411 family)
MQTNRLIHETSPYLLQHAHNPVNWFPWGNEALKKAKQENKPILVSIGYAACHWCHVMEKESFENEAIAALMNQYFINIKVDREERPDIDHIYMDAVQAMAGNGGWPLNVFLTPDAIPFYGGTYFPPAAAHNRMSWIDTIKAVYTAFQEKRNEIEAQADSLKAHLIAANSFGIQSPSISPFTNENLLVIAANILKQADTTWGGFGKAPKFPQTFSIQYLLRHYHFSKNKEALQQALLSLDKMIDGGIYDQIGGGFARYSTDNQWLAPHFEKMLYDNALLIGVIAEAYQLTKNEKYATIIEQTIHFIEQEMLSEEGGFYSALDADSEGIEGKFYTWSKQEIETILKEESALFCDYFQVIEKGNWEQTNILWVQENMQSFSKEHNINETEFKRLLKKNGKVLLEERNKRIKPQLDDKILLGWNALLCNALCKAFAATGNEHYKVLAKRNMLFLEKKFEQQNGSWLHTYKKGQAKISAFLDDYAYTIQAYIALQEITGNLEYIKKAKKITEFVIDFFSEETSGFFFYTHHEQTDVIVRKKEVYDGAIPSGNSIMAGNLLYLSMVYNIPIWKERAELMLQSVSNAIIKYPTSFGAWASIFQQVVVGVHEIVVVGYNAVDNLPALLQLFMPNKIIVISKNNNNEIPLLANKFKEGETGYFLCKDYACEEPVFNFNEFLHLCNTKSYILH